MGEVPPSLRTSSVPETHILDGKNSCYPETSTHPLWHMCTPMHTRAHAEQIRSKCNAFLTRRWMTSVEQLGSCSQDWLLETCGWNRRRRAPVNSGFHPSLLKHTHFSLNFVSHLRPTIFSYCVTSYCYFM